VTSLAFRNRRRPGPQGRRRQTGSMTRGLRAAFRAYVELDALAADEDAAQKFLHVRRRDSSRALPAEDDLFPGATAPGRPGWSSLLAQAIPRGRSRDHGAR